LYMDVTFIYILFELLFHFDTSNILMCRMIWYFIIIKNLNKLLKLMEMKILLITQYINNVNILILWPYVNSM
jgi:hypothetical protein